MITFLSGGTGTPKLLQGVRSLVSDQEIAVIVNTAEDIWYQGGHISPDLDTIMYLFADRLNIQTWWGQKNDTFITHESLLELGEDAYIAIGDRDRAVELARARMLQSGMTLTEATHKLCKRLGVTSKLFPMTDTEYQTLIRTPEGTIHFQEYWVRYRATVPALEVIRFPSDPPSASPEVIRTIQESEAVIIGPSNPVTSILPILECKGVIDALKGQFVIAISPFIGDQPVSGPARELMEARGISPDSIGVYELYHEIIDLFIHDIRDTSNVQNAIRADTLMVTPEVATRLTEEILKYIPKRGI